MDIIIIPMYYYYSHLLYPKTVDYPLCIFINHRSHYKINEFMYPNIFISTAVSNFICCY